VQALVLALGDGEELREEALRPLIAFGGVDSERRPRFVLRSRGDLKPT
jgi:hypothetical protein